MALWDTDNCWHMAVEQATGSTTAHEVEFKIENADCFFIRASEELSCQLSLERLIRQSDGDLLEFFAVENADPEKVVAYATEAPSITEARPLATGNDSGVVEVVVSESCVTTTLADVGAVTETVAASDGVGQVVAEVPAHVDVRTVVEEFVSEHSGAEFRASRPGANSVPVRTSQGFKGALAGQLTEKQLEVFRTAHFSGYFEWPRSSTAEECAEMLGIAQPTFSQHMRTVQRTIADCLFEGMSDTRSR